ncbi:MAG: AMP-binding protein [Syntrophales bacterium]
MTTVTEPVYSEKGDTWPKILRYNYEKYGDKHKAMRHKNLGIWKPYTWKDYYLNVKYLALGLSAIGFEPGNKLLIVGDNAPQWYYAELAAQANHGVSVGTYSDLTPQEIKYIAENCEASFAVVEDQEQADKLLQIKDELPLLKKVIYWNYKGLAHYHDAILLGYRGILQAGEQYEKEHPGLFERKVDEGKADDVCAIVYTSGTSGAAPKGAVHTYRTMKAGADYHLCLDPWHENDNVIPYLPPAWMTEQWFGIGCHLLSGCILNFAEASDTQQRDTKEIQPNIVFYNSRLWQKQASAVQARIESASAVKKFAYRRLMPIGYRMADLKYKKINPGLFLKMLHAIADFSLFRSLRSSLGLSNSRICYTTGSLLSMDACKFYHAINIPLKSLYGTTEGGALTGAGNDDICLETVGPAHRGTEVKITAEGELVYRQPGGFVGYYKDQKKTEEVIKDGWFYSGDGGFIREDGHIVFVDRIKSLILLPNGRQLAPQFIESQLTFNPYIKDAWVIAGKEKAYVSVIIIIDYNAVGRWAGQRRVAYSTFAELSQRPEVQELVKQAIEQINITLPVDSRIMKYVNLHREFDPNEGELTRTRKLRRAVLEERYQELIKAIYADKTEALIETRASARDGQTDMAKTTLSIGSVGGTAL